MLQKALPSTHNMQMDSIPQSFEPNLPSKALQK